MDLSNPYENKYFPDSILEGLKFYYELFDKIDLKIYLKSNFPIKRKDVMLAISFLSSIAIDDNINNLCNSHPSLTLGIESIEKYSTLTTEELSYDEILIITFLYNFLSTATDIMFFKAKNDIPVAICDLSVDEKIKYLIENKFYYTQNEGSFPTEFIKKTVAYCDSQIEKYKELKILQEPDLITYEVKKMVENYFLLISNSIQSNDLISPLIEKKFEEFISKLKKMLLIPSYFDIKAEDKERTFHIYLIGVLQGRVEGYKVFSNKESGIGRYDIALFPIETKNPGVIIEIKKIDVASKIEKELNEALQQIKIKLYHTELSSLGVSSILNIAIVFEGLEPHIKHEISFPSFVSS